VLLAITYGHAPELTMDEFVEITDFLDQRTGRNAEVIFGTSMDPELGDSIRVTVIATGFEKETASASEQAMKESLLIREGLQGTHFEERKPVQEQPVQQYIPPTPPAPAEPVRRWVEERPSQQAPSNPAPAPMYQQTQAAEPQKEYLSIDGEYQLVYKSPPDVERPLDEFSQVSAQTPPSPVPDRTALLRRMSQGSIVRTNYDDPEFLRHNEQPAYLRKQNGGAPSQESMSRYTMNENNEILNNNRYLHDNVD
jgi:cell division protein FtsZ